MLLVAGTSSSKTSRTALNALVAAGPAHALTASPMAAGPASAGFFDKTPGKVERGATSDFPKQRGHRLLRR